MSDIKSLDLVLKYLSRPLTEREEAAIICAIPNAFREAYQNCAVERFEAHQEVEKCRRELESANFAEFVETWMDQE